MAFTVPGYQVDQLIGYGSHAEVWSGRTAASAEPVALKRIILPGHSDPHRAAELIRSARTEAALLTALEHPSLIRLRQYVQTPSAVVLVMELAAGGSLAQLLRRRDRLSPAEVAAALSPVAAALAYAHAEGVLHGDVSAANILFTAIGQSKLADLGVARMLIGHAGADQSLGTPAYVDPVVAAGGAAGAASDVFSLAAVALQCVTGAGPWQSDDRADLRAVLARAATGVIEDLPGKLAGCPEAMVAVLSRALDPEPHRRGTAAEFALDLGASVPSVPVVLSAGRILPRVGRHAAERPEPIGSDAVPADLTHVSRLQVRPEQVEPGPADRPARRLARVSAILVIAVLGVAVLGVAAVAALAAVRSHSWPILGAGRPASAEPAPSAMKPADPRGTDPQAAAEHPAADQHAGNEAVDSLAATGVRPVSRSRAVAAVEAAGDADVADPQAVLRKLADRRAEAFALNRPELLAGVYQSPVLLAQDLSQLNSRIPAGCGLIGLRTSYQDVTVISAGLRRLELQAIASQPPASLVCAGAVRSRTLPAVPVRLALSLVRVGTEFRIASQRPGGP
ncbi:MAG: eukaryotic-like serine/threonine-protein kinase [Pseudonocardiales bacterium]|nr:eukaryotic-like serine/threonine-protein kinase [Pseudonocardiales bacterium]